MAGKETTKEKESIKPVIWIRRTPNFISYKVSKLLIENNITELSDLNETNVLKITKSATVFKNKFIETCTKYTNTARGRTVFFLNKNNLMSVFVSDLSEDDLMKMLPKLLSLKVFW